MKNYRMSKGTTEHYTSLEDLRAGFHLDPFTKRTKDATKLKNQRERFLNSHICKACGKPMTYMHGNIMTCTNPECKGIEIKREDAEGDVSVTYITSYDILNETGAAAASNIFD